MEEADVQPNAVGLFGFVAEDVASVNNMVRLDAGWAFTLRDAEGRWHVATLDEATHAVRRYALPVGSTVPEEGLLLAAERLHVTTSVAGTASGVMLHTWDLGTDQVTARTFDDLPSPAHPVGAWNDDVLLVAPKGLLAGDSSAWVLRGGDLLSITADGRVMDAAMVTGMLYLAVEQDGTWRVESHSIDEGRLLTHWTGESPIGGVWGNDGHAAFSVIVDSGAPAGGRLYEIDHFRHDVTRMGDGWNVDFVGNSVHYVTAAEGTSPFLAQWSRAEQTYSEGAFLPDGERWDATSDGVWWLEVPRTDHRYKETVNPTPFSIMLMTYA